MATLSQNRIALQSRLDICTQQLTKNRRDILETLVATNTGLEKTIWGIYAARGVQVFGPIGKAVGKAGETVLLQMNRSLALYQETRLTLSRVRELTLRRCAPTPYSDEGSLCRVEVPLQPRRAKTLFPDVQGLLTLPTPSRKIGRFSCQARGMETVMALQGNPSLRDARFIDTYEK